MINDDLYVVHARVAGLDIHKMQITATVRLCETKDGTAHCETRAFPAIPGGLEQLRDWLLGYGVTAAGMEGTGTYWQAPWDILAAAGLKWNCTMRSMSDSCGDVFGKIGRMILDGLATGRSKESILDGLSGHVRRKPGRLSDALRASLSDNDCFMLGALLDQYDFLNRQIRQCSRRIETQLEPFEQQLRLLETIPGIRRQSACDLIIEIGGDIGVFDNARQFSSWCGLSPGNNESAGKRRSARPCAAIRTYAPC